MGELSTRKGRVSFSTLFVLLLLMFVSFCEERDWINPFDPSATLDSNAWRTSNIVLEVLNDRMVKLVWSNREQRTEGYEIFHGIGDSVATLLQKIPKTQEWTVDSLLSDVTHHFLLRAFAGSNHGQFSDTVFASLTFPMVRTLTFSFENYNSITLKWSLEEGYAQNYDVQGYHIERRNEDTEFTPLAIVGPGSDTYIDTSVMLGIKYFYSIVAINYVNQSKARLGGAPILEIRTPMGPSASLISDESILLTWTSANEFETEYAIHRFKNGLENGVIDTGDSAALFTDTNLEYGQTYSYAIASVTPVNESELSSATVPIEVKIPAPSNLVLEAINDNAIHLSWVDNCQFESGYRLLRDEGSGYQLIAELPENSVEYEDTGLQYAREYDYLVLAHTQNNESEGVSMTASPLAPVPISLLVTRVNQFYNEISWVDVCTSETEFLVERNEGLGFQGLDQLIPNSSLYSDFTADNANQEGYSYRVGVRTGDGIVHYTPEFEIINFVFDIDGNRYEVNRMGNKFWMTTNLSVSRYKNGVALEYVSDFSSWTHTGAGVYTIYTNDPDNGSQYGATYNRNAVLNSNGLAPDGWRIALSSDFLATRNAMNHLKPGYGNLLNSQCIGYVDFRTGQYEGVNDVVTFWCRGSSTITGYMSYCGGNTLLPGNWAMNNFWGLSVRCVKDA